MYDTNECWLFNSNPPKNTVSPWSLPCICSTSRCHCNSCLRLDLLCVQGLPYQSNRPDIINTSLTIQFLEFTYTNDCYLDDKITTKLNKYQPLLDNLWALGWKVAPFAIISTWIRGTTHIPSISQLKTTYKFKEALLKTTLTNINTIAIQHLTSIFLHKRRLENNQPLPDPRLFIFIWPQNVTNTHYLHTQLYKPFFVIPTYI